MGFHVRRSWALVRYQVRGASVLALRGSAFLFATLIVASSLVPVTDISVAARRVATGLVGPNPDQGIRILFVALSLVFTLRGGRLLNQGQGGWIRSLPASARHHRVAQAIGLLVTLLPLIVLTAGAILLSFLDTGALDVVAVAGALAALPVTAIAGVRSRPLPARLGVVAAAFLVTFGLPGIAVSAPLCVAWFSRSGTIALARRRSRRWATPAPMVALMIGWRAVGVRAFWAYLTAMMAVGAGVLYRINNDLSTGEARPIVRLLLLWGVVGSIAVMGDLLALRSMPWPWSRSLPVRASTRCLRSGLLLLPPAVVAVGATAVLDHRAALVALGALPTLALIGATALRRARGRISRMSGEFLTVGGAIGTLLGVWPLGLAATPLLWIPLLRLSSRLDRRLRVAYWEPLNHSALGDSLVGDPR